MKQGAALRTDGDSRADIDGDGIPDGDGSYGQIEGELNLDWIYERQEEMKAASGSIFNFAKKPSKPPKTPKKPPKKSKGLLKTLFNKLIKKAETKAKNQYQKKTHTEKVGVSRSPKRMTYGAKKEQKKAAKEAGKGFKDSFKDTVRSVKSAGKTLLNATGINGKQKKEQAVDKIYGITRGIGTTIAHPIKTAKGIAAGIRKKAKEKGESYVGGYILGEVTQTVVAAGAAAAAGKGLKGAKAAKKNIKKTANDINDITKDYSKAIRDFAKYAENLKMSRTVQNHIEDVIKRGANAGRVSRPYIDSNGTTLLLKEIMESREPISDAILKSGLRWDVKGTFRGTTGTWELVVDTKTGTVVHFNFVAQ